jgi:hypothetical protein
MGDSDHLRRHAAPVVAAEALLAHQINDQAILRYLTRRWALGPSDAISALSAARALAEDPDARTALPPDPSSR